MKAGTYTSSWNKDIRKCTHNLCNYFFSRFSISKLMKRSTTKKKKTIVTHTARISLLIRNTLYKSHAARLSHILITSLNCGGATMLADETQRKFCFRQYDDKYAYNMQCNNIYLRGTYIKRDLWIIRCTIMRLSIDVCTYVRYRACVLWLTERHRKVAKYRKLDSYTIIIPTPIDIVRYSNFSAI